VKINVRRIADGYPKPVQWLVRKPHGSFLSVWHVHTEEVVPKDYWVVVFAQQTHPSCVVFWRKGTKTWQQQPVRGSNPREAVAGVIERKQYELVGKIMNS